MQGTWMRKVQMFRYIAARGKGKVYKMVVGPALLYGLEVVALTVRW